MLPEKKFPSLKKKFPKPSLKDKIRKLKPRKVLDEIKKVAKKIKSIK